MPIVFRDIETRSAVDLKVVGAHRYAADPTTGVWCAGYAVDDGPVEIWIPGQPIPECFIEAARNPDWLIVAHNDAFERVIEERILHPQFEWPLVPLERHRCTMATALAAALPGALEKAIEALGLPYPKDKAGRTLMRKMAKPVQGGWIEDPASLEQLCAYCRRDVEAERALYHALPQLIEDERRYWELDAVINSRGFYTDSTLLDAAHKVVTEAEAALQAEFREITGLGSTNQTAKLIAWLAERSCAVADVQKGTLKHVLRRKGLAPEVRRAIELRLKLAHASAAKVEALRAWRGDNGRVRGTLQYHGAATGRWVGRGPQPQNFKRDGEKIEAKIAAVLNGGAGLESPVEAVGDIARAMITAAPGHRLLVGDFSGIESRVLAWISGQDSKLKAWVRFDQTGDPNDDPYVIIGRALGHSEDTARAYGKICDLAFGYQGGVGAWQNFAPENDASDEVTIKRYRDSWRNQHPATVRFWYALDRAAINAIHCPSTDYRIVARGLNDRVTFRYDAPFLRVRLPSGRSISYPFPRTEVDKFGHARVTFLDNAGGKFTDCRFGNGAYGGLWTENIVSGIARDLLAAALIRLDAAGYPVTLHVHDEVVCEVPNGFGSVDEFKRIVTEMPAWGEGLPIAAKVRSGPRFAKTEEGVANCEARSVRAEPESAASPPPETPWDDPIADLYATAAAESATADSETADPRLPWTTPCTTEVLPGTTEFTTIFIGLSDKDRALIRPPAGGNGHAGASPPLGGSGTDKEPRGGAVAVYIYLTERNEPHLKVVRTVKKGFPQSFWVNGAWVNKKPVGWVQLPYRLPQLTAAAPTEPVWICEGEKDALNVAALGLVATCNPEGGTYPNGTGRWQPELSQWFRGRQTAYILEDNDAGGRAHTIAVGSALHSIVADLRVVPFPELPEHGDVSDWLETGRTREELLARAQAAPRFEKPTLELESARASTFTMRAVEWVWPGRFAVGKLGIIAGLPDEGKGQILCDITARITRPGSVWPCDEGIALFGNVILLTAEDDIDDTIVPRLKAADADLEHVEILRMVRESEGARMFSLVTDLALLRRKIVEVGDVRMVQIDPVTAYLGVKKMDSWRTPDVRAVLGPLVQLASELRVAIIGIMHFNKKTDVTNALLRISDSLAFGATARHVYAVVNDPDNQRKLFVKAKNNIAPAEQKALAYVFQMREVGPDVKTGEPIWAPHIVWAPDHVDVTATEAMQAAAESKAPAARDTAKEFLADLLINGPLPSADVEEAAIANGIPRRMLFRAKGELKIVARQDGELKAGHRVWRWHLPTGKDND
jgi:DNA polymerase